MGHYTELHCQIKLRKDTPVSVIELLTRVVTNGDLGLPKPGLFDHNDVFKPEIDHPFFKTERWFMLLLSNNFDPNKKGGRFHQNSNGHWILTIDCEYKNYDGELQKFCDWIAPYIQNRKKIKCLGWWNYESNFGNRFNIYLHEGKIDLWCHSKKELGTRIAI